ncbi:MAG: hypothetical protein R2795_05500 [Saprospiraceae bacterium]
MADTLPTNSKIYQTIHYLKPRGEHQLWLATNLGLFSFDKRTSRFIWHETPQVFQPITASDNDCSETLPLGSWQDDLLLYNPCLDQWRQVRQPLPPQVLGGERYVGWVFPYQNTYWALGRAGLWVVSKDWQTLWHQQETATTAQMPIGLLKAYFKDANNAVWLGGEQGLWLYDPRAQHIDYTH